MNEVQPLTTSEIEKMFKQTSISEAFDAAKEAPFDYFFKDAFNVPKDEFLATTTRLKITNLQELMEIAENLLQTQQDADKKSGEDSLDNPLFCEGMPQPMDDLLWTIHEYGQAIFSEKALLFNPFKKS